MVTESKKAPCLATLQGAIDAAVQELEDARVTENSARLRATVALNRLNRAYGDLEEALAVIRNGAPRGSDWGENRRTGSDAPCAPRPIEPRRIG